MKRTKRSNYFNCPIFSFSMSVEESDKKSPDTSGLTRKEKLQKYKKDKPWDNENIDHWKVEVLNKIYHSSRNGNRKI